MALVTKPLDQVRPDVPTIAATDLVRINLNVSPATRHAWKLAALQRNTTLANLILEAMSKHLND